jgi:membrane-associated phospholipid phosphatase
LNPPNLQPGKRLPSSTSIALLLSLAVSGGCFAQAQTNLPNAPAPQPDVSLKALPLNVAKDQKAIWTSPAHLRIKDLNWLVPLGAVTGFTIATDRDAMVHVVSHDAQFNKHSVDASNILTGGMIAAPVGLLGWGELKHNARAREAGLLGAEAMADSVAVEQGLKLIFWRERPGVDNANGKFFQSGSGIDSSFPSSHAVITWSSAAVLAGEYDSPLQRLLIYSAATGVSMTRVMGREHFPTDVIVGSAAGWLVGHYVFRKHHNESLDDYY